MSNWSRLTIASFHLLLAFLPFLASGGHFIDRWYTFPLLVLNGFIQGTFAAYRMYSLHAVMSRVRMNGSSNEHAGADKLFVYGKEEGTAGRN